MISKASKKTVVLRYRYLDPFVFIHINKTGGTSVSKALNIPLEHKTAIQFIDEMGQAAWDRKLSFVTVRNPWDKVVSHYHHRLQSDHTDLAQIRSLSKNGSSGPTVIMTRPTTTTRSSTARSSIGFQMPKATSLSKKSCGSKSSAKISVRSWKNSIARSSCPMRENQSAATIVTTTTPRRSTSWPIVLSLISHGLDTCMNRPAEIYATSRSESGSCSTPLSRVAR